MIAAENRSFYATRACRYGAPPGRSGRPVTGEQLQGGSTITQQMVRNYYGGIGKERSVHRKLKEIRALHAKVGQEKPKDSDP